jgi:hypothetical protein
MLQPALTDGSRRTATELLDDDGRHVATIYALRDGIHITCGAWYEIDGAGIALEREQPTGLHVAFTRR